jgi:transcriptional regulator with XRE-family HTH domain
MSAKHSDLYKTVGRTIQHYRKAKGLTQEELAAKASISVSYLTKIEAQNCDKSFSLEVLFDISSALDINVTQLFERL